MTNKRKRPRSLVKARETARRWTREMDSIYAFLDSLPERRKSLGEFDPESVELDLEERTKRKRLSRLRELYQRNLDDRGGDLSLPAERRAGKTFDPRAPTPSKGIPAEARAILDELTKRPTSGGSSIDLDDDSVDAIYIDDEFAD